MARRGVTLLELIFVIAIITILVSIILPSIRIARNKSKQIACVNNLKQIGQSMYMYLWDSGTNRFPQCDGLPTDSQTNRLDTILKPYLREQTIWFCPTNESPNITNYSYMYNDTAKGQSYHSNIDSASKAWVVMDYFVVTIMNEKDAPHSKRLNVVYVDWHVSSIRADEYMDNSASIDIEGWK